MDVFTIFPVHLYKDTSLIHCKNVYLIEDEEYFTKYFFHKTKLIFHRATMKYYRDYLINKGYKVKYIEFHEKYLNLIKNKNVYMYETDNHNLNKKLLNNNININILNNLSFYISMKDLEYYNLNIFKTKFSHNNSFYRYIRTLTKILPLNKYKLSYDKENREKFSKDFSEPLIKDYSSKSYISRAKKYINKWFPENPESNLNIFPYPVTHDDAKKHLKHFIKHLLNDFGKYQDAISEKVIYGFHSVLSPMLNVGLLTDHDVIKLVCSVDAPINSVEGFIRQILGWKQGARYLYHFHFSKFSKNYLSMKNSAKPFWYAKTLIPIVDNCIKKAFNYSYLHHIERLMIMGNFMTLCLVKPSEIFNWFMCIVSIDAYEWTMYPNIYGMATFSDNGFMMSRPYISSSNYILKMTNEYVTSRECIEKFNCDWPEIWDALYYNFIDKKQKKLVNNYFMSSHVKKYLKMDKKKKLYYKKLASKYLKYLYGKNISFT